jgi:lysozyme family protein
VRYSHKWPEYRDQWDRMVIQKQHLMDDCANFAIAHKAIYQDIEKRTGVPWEMSAVLHRRESNQDKHGNPMFTTYLGNGQPLSRVTTIVPRGRGPFLGPNAFADGAVDAYRIDGLSSVKDWRLEKMLYYCEIYNGTGYANKGLPSPYIWGGTNIQRRGKYIADGRFDPNEMDVQPGCAPMLATIAKLDPTVKFVRED